MRTIRFGFENLEVWQKSVDFANKVISFAEEIKTDGKHYRLIGQLEAAVTSIAINTCPVK